MSKTKWLAGAALLGAGFLMLSGGKGKKAKKAKDPKEGVQAIGEADYMVRAERQGKTFSEEERARVAENLEAAKRLSGSPAYKAAANSAAVGFAEKLAGGIGDVLGTIFAGGA